MKIEEHHSLLAHNTFRIPAMCRWFSEYTSVERLQELLASPLAKVEKILPIGAGSNLLFCNDFEGIVLHSKIDFIEPIGEDAQSVFLNVGSGVVWDDFVAYAVAHGWGGCENLSHIPGEVGASAVQNIGAYGVEVKDVIERVNCIEIASGTMVEFSLADCQYGYRTSIFKKALKGKYIVTSVVFRLSKQPVFKLSYGNLKEAMGEGEITLSRIRKTVIAVRRKKLPDPQEMGSAGSFFMNPVIEESHYRALQAQYPTIPGYVEGENRIKVPAGWLIEQCGLKGYSVGGASVYEKQCLVLVNRSGTATASQIRALATHVVSTVSDRFGITISPEVNYIQ